jgi:hypothetical protein
MTASCVSSGLAVSCCGGNSSGETLVGGCADVQVAGTSPEEGEVGFVASADDGGNADVNCSGQYSRGEMSRIGALIESAGGADVARLGPGMVLCRC